MTEELNGGCLDEREAIDMLAPVVSLGYHQSEDGTYRAVMTVSGLATEQQAGAALDHMQKLFCGEQMEATND